MGSLGTYGSMHASEMQINTKNESVQKFAVLIQSMDQLEKFI